MASRLSLLSLFLHTYLASFLSVGYTFLAGVDEFKDKQPFIFPEVKTDSAIESVTSLLNSQRTYQKEIDRGFREICEKNKNHTEVDLLERSIDRTIEMVDELIHNSTEIIREQAKNRSASDYFKKKPMTYKTSRLLLECWKYVEDFVDNYVRQYDFNVNPETDLRMRKAVDFATREIKAYQKYLEIVYEETGIFRDDETNFNYLKYKKKLDKQTESDY